MTSDQHFRLNHYNVVIVVVVVVLVVYYILYLLYSQLVFRASWAICYGINRPPIQNHIQNYKPSKYQKLGYGSFLAFNNNSDICMADSLFSSFVFVDKENFAGIVFQSGAFSRRSSGIDFPGQDRTSRVID